ncbi:MAG TPA: class I SAM-dependent methyltransferase [Ktedonobacterales bacterium]|nr:class I SAM-dependent methyltransferase [Ktedonobacterales bacterium]
MAARDGSHGSHGSHDALVEEQITYYRARANEYDEWFLRQGRYDHGAEENTRWHAEVAEVAGALDDFLRERPIGSMLEIAAGTGLWTQRLAPFAQRLTALDAAPEALAINCERLGALAERVTYATADIFSWSPAERYDAIFFSFWLSHVPPERFDGFWARVREWLAPGGRVFLVDSSYEPASTARDHLLEGAEATTVERILNDGQRFRIVKVFYTPEKLGGELARLGWGADLRATPRYFLYGSATPRSPGA